MKNLYFASSNKFKHKEVGIILKGSGYKLMDPKIDAIQEILHKDLEEIVRDKTLKAYAALGLPCVVEHGAIHIEAMNELPGGLSKVMWDNVGDKMCNYIGATESRAAIAKSVVGYCDGKKIYLFSGETKGEVAKKARGGYRFQWDPIFIPEGIHKTYAEIGSPKKLKYSQAAKAWKLLLDHLKS